MIIRDNSASVDGLAAVQSGAATAMRTARKDRRRVFGSLSGSTIASYAGVFLLVFSLIALAYRPPVNENSLAYAQSSTNGSKQSSQVGAAVSVSVDQLVATNLASSLAASTDMPISNNVANLSQSLAVESVLAQTDTNVVSKPQIVQPTASSLTPQKYSTVKGDTVPALAIKFNVSADTIRWVNNLTSDALDPGTTLTILPVSGILYTVKSGDTLYSIAAKYGTSRAVIASYNNLDLSGDPAPGVQLILPGGILPTSERPGYVAPVTRQATVTGLSSSYAGDTSAGNRYAYGNCTWYAYERREQLGEPVGSFWGNAATWPYDARLAGFLVDGNPAPGAVMANGGGYGHVAVVESVNPGVSITISEMNAYRFGGGFARVDHGDISWVEATSGMYQYIH